MNIISILTAWKQNDVFLNFDVTPFAISFVVGLGLMRFSYRGSARFRCWRRCKGCSSIGRVTRSRSVQIEKLRKRLSSSLGEKLSVSATSREVLSWVRAWDPHFEDSRLVSVFSEQFLHPHLAWFAQTARFKRTWYSSSILEAVPAVTSTTQDLRRGISRKFVFIKGLALGNSRGRGAWQAPLCSFCLFISQFAGHGHWKAKEVIKDLGENGM